MLELTLDTNLENIALVGGGFQESKDMVLGTGAFTRLCQAARISLGGFETLGEL
jgi:hypothetical protein